MILNYNSWEMTNKLALKLATFEGIKRVVIVDNQSTDKSYEMLSRIKNEKIKVILSEKNGGYCYGNNLGVRELADERLDIAFIVNPDVDIAESSVLEILRAFQTTEYKLLSGVEYDIDDNLSNPPIWVNMTYKDDMLSCSFLGRKRKKVYPHIQSAGVQEVDLVKGSFLAFKIQDFLEVGGFDENVFLFCEKRIIARKFRDKKKIGIVLAAKYNHNHTASINKTYKASARQMKILYQSRWYYNVKYNKIGKIKKIILKISMNISLMEFRIVDLMRGK